MVNSNNNGTNLIEIDWQINYLCNFNCFYCFPSAHSNKDPSIVGSLKPTEIIYELRKLSSNLTIHLTGGEPLLYPGFVDLCETLTKNYKIGLNTNLSLDTIYHFIARVNRERVNIIHCAVHIMERERIERGIKKFARRFLSLKQNGFRVSANYVAHPAIIPRMAEDILKFRQLGIKVVAKVFRGTYKNKTYPQDYTRPERNGILRFIHRSSDKMFLESLPNYKGRTCRTGWFFVVVTPEGDVHRCTTYRLRLPKQKLGNLFIGNVKLFERSLNCQLNECLCPYQGMAYAE